jgi:hypothetical protein
LSKRAVVERAGKPEPVLDERLLASPIAPIHALKLGKGLVRFVDHEQKVGREIVDQGRRWLAGRTPG